MRKKSFNTFRIDSKKLKTALKERGLKTEIVSVATGHCKSYISQCIWGNSMPFSEAILLDRMYGIPRSEYEHIEPTPEPVAETPATEQPQTSGIDYVALYNTIYAAVYAALKANASDMRDRLFDREAM